MKIIATLILLSLILSSCTVYDKKIVEQLPAKYEYRCVDNVCKDVNINYKVERIPKDKYKYFSTNNLERIDDTYAVFSGIGLYLFGLGFPIAAGIGTASTVGIGKGILAGLGVGMIVAPITMIIILGYSCSNREDVKFYKESCYGYHKGNKNAEPEKQADFKSHKEVKLN